MSEQDVLGVAQSNAGSLQCTAHQQQAYGEWNNWHVLHNTWQCWHAQQNRQQGPPPPPPLDPVDVRQNKSTAENNNIAAEVPVTIGQDNSAPLDSDIRRIPLPSTQRQAEVVLDAERRHEQPQGPAQGSYYYPPSYLPYPPPPPYYHWTAPVPSGVPQQNANPVPPPVPPQMNVNRQHAHQQEEAQEQAQHAGNPGVRGRQGGRGRGGGRGGNQPRIGREETDNEKLMRKLKAERRKNSYLQEELRKANNKVAVLERLQSSCIMIPKK